MWFGDVDYRCSVVQLAPCGRDLCALGPALLHFSIPDPGNSWPTLCLYEFAKAGTSYKCSHIIFVLLLLIILSSVVFSKLLHHRLHQISTYSNVWIISHCMFMPLYVCVSVHVCMLLSMCTVLKTEPTAFCKSSTIEHTPSPVSATRCSFSFCL